ncbi:MAG: hypothetical protein U9N59_14510 [Campylobacterota bacterium]|nr:hypothetical protein [Campylobacterota bacterium]
MDWIILAVLVFVVWKTMKFVYDLMNKKISNIDHKDKNDDS